MMLTAETIKNQDLPRLQQPLGIAVVGGLVLSQVLTLYTTPVAYLAVEHVRLRGNAPLALGSRRD